MQRQKRQTEGWVKTEAETGMMQLQTKRGHALPVATQSKEEARKGSSLKPTERDEAADILIVDSQPPKL